MAAGGLGQDAYSRSEEKGRSPRHTLEVEPLDAGSLGDGVG